jgi:lipoprotein-releasing system permease protein
MNGFRKDVRDRMLSVISDVEVFAPDGGALPDPALTLAEVRRNPQVIGAAPFVGGQGLLARGEAMQGVMVRGIDPALEPQVTEVAAQLKDTLLPQLTPGAFGICWA